MYSIKQEHKSQLYISYNHAKILSTNFIFWWYHSFFNCHTIIYIFITYALLQIYSIIFLHFPTIKYRIWIRWNNLHLIEFGTFHLKEEIEKTFIFYILVAVIFWLLSIYLLCLKRNKISKMLQSDHILFETRSSSIMNWSSRTANSTSFLK